MAVGEEAGAANGSAAGTWAADPYGRNQMRYYDGREWTDTVSNGGVVSLDPATPRMPIPSTSDAQRRRKTPRWRPVGSIPSLVLLLVVAVVIGAFATGQVPTFLKFGPDGVVEMHFESAAGDVAQSDIKDAAGDLERAAVENEAAAREGAPAAEPQDADVSGEWIGDNGLTYAFQQFGANVTWQEISPYGVTAVGEGSVDGNVVAGRFTAVNNTYGLFRLMLTGDELAGTINNDVYGSFDVTLRRVD